MSATDRVVDTIQRNSSRPFLIEGSGGRSWTYGEADRIATAIAEFLRARGVAPGDRVLVGLPNSCELALLYLGALYAGATVAPLGSGFGRRELRQVLGSARPRLGIMAASPQASGLETVAREAGIELVRIGDDAEQLPLGATDGAPSSAPLAAIDDDSIVSIHFTSGSTGTPRGVGHRFADFVGNAERYAAAIELRAEHRFHATLPMTYMAGYYNLLLLPLVIGASVVIDRAFDARSVLSFWKTPIEHDANVLWLVPTIMAMLLRVDRGDTGRDYCRDRVDHLACGTAPLDPDLRERFEQRYEISVHESYGLSETLLATSSTRQHPASRGSVGRVLDGVEVRIESPGPDQPGAVLIRSPDTMVGYLQGCDANDNPVFADKLDSQGWLDTGDLGRIDEQGELRLTGRAKDLIIRGGVNVSAVEIERGLDTLPAIEHLAIVGVPHEILGEQIAAVVAVGGDEPFEQIEEALRQRAGEGLDGTRRPDLYVQIDEMPLTPTGKVRRAAVRDMVIDLLGLPAGAKAFQLGTSDDGDGEPVPEVPGWPAGRIVDLSHAILEGMTSFPSPNHPRPQVTVLARHETEGRMTRRLVLGTHTGTHLDAPLHFVPGGTSVEGLDLSALVGPAVVADLTDAEPLAGVGRDRLAQALGGRLRQPRVLLRFGWSRRFDSLDFYSQSPYLSGDACRWLLDQGVRLIGMDIPSPDDPRQGQDSDDDSPNHHLLLGAGVILLEYLNGLDQLRSDEVFLVALPLPVQGADGAPARVVAFEPQR